MNGKTLAHWQSIHKKRQDGSSFRKLLSLPSISVLLSFVFGLSAWNRLSQITMKPAAIYMAGDIKPLWMALLVFAVGMLSLKIPTELYWRSDSSFLARLPIHGKSHFYCALKNSARICFWLWWPVFVTVGVYFICSGDAATTLKQVVFALAIAFAALTLGMAASMLAGLVVSSSQMQNALNSMGGEFQAPKSSWLGILPGLAGTVIMAAVLGGAGWPVGDDIAFGGIQVLLIPLLVGGVFALAWATRAADKQLPAAMREVSALDREILAFVERAGPSKCERVFSGLFSSSPSGLALSLKDATLMRRRYPMPLFLFFLFLGLFLISLFVGGAFFKNWGLVFFVLGLLVVLYLGVCVRKNPIERIGYLKTLPLSGSEIARSKMSFVVMRSLLFVVLTCVPWALVSKNVVVPLATGGLALLATNLIASLSFQNIKSQ